MTLHIAGLSKSVAGRRIIDALTLDVVPGERLAFVGPPGSGKSTLLALIAGLLRPDAGSLSIGGFDMYYQPAQAKRRVGYVPQEAPGVAPLTADEYLRLLAEIYGLSEQQFVERAEALSWLRDDASPRRTRLLGAMLHLPSLLLIDEPRAWPTEDLEAVERAAAETVREGGATIIATRDGVVAQRLHARVVALGTLSAAAGGTP
ncbi:ATP-binding cassette domain-containing protein [bacterium]|nr:MAG: ATP-binding cassette domain-containing protein [bacterium]